MSTAVGEMLKQAEQLSAEERVELTTRLMEQARQGVGDRLSTPIGEATDEEVMEPLDVFSLKRMPPEESFVVRMRFVDAGVGEPARYDFSGIFDDDEDAEVE
ncbi:MAG: hypothetical protein ACRD82_15795 [Blastocatellia bacterium]